MVKPENIKHIPNPVSHHRMFTVITECQQIGYFLSDKCRNSRPDLVFGNFLKTQTVPILPLYFSPSRPPYKEMYTTKPTSAMTLTCHFKLNNTWLSDQSLQAPSRHLQEIVLRCFLLTFSLHTAVGLPSPAARSLQPGMPSPPHPALKP